MKFSRSVLNVMFMAAIAVAVSNCTSSRKPKPVKVENKPAPTQVPGDSNGSNGGGFVDPNDPNNGGSNNGGANNGGGSSNGGANGGNGNGNGTGVTPTPTPIPPAPTQIPSNPNNPTPVPPVPPANNEIKIKLSDGTEKVIQWNGKEDLDSTGRYSIKTVP